MLSPGPACTLRIYLGETDTCGHRPLYESIVMKAHELGLAGATVVRGSMGFGAGNRIHTSKVLRLSDDLPIIVEIVDRQERIDLLLPYLDEVMEGGLVTIAVVEVFKS